MRNFTLLKRLAVLPLAAVLAFTSCENKKMDNSCTVTSSDIDLKANPARVVTPAEGKTYKLNVQVSGDVTWTAKSNNTNLVTVSKTDIQNTSGELLLTVTPNTTYSSRSGVVTIASPALYSTITINITQPAVGAPSVQITLLDDKDALDINAEGDTLRYEIVSEPITPLIYQINPESTLWISTVEGKTTEWIFAANISDQPRSSWVCVKYNNGQNAADTIYFTQKGAEMILTPAVTVAAADNHARMATLKWATTPEVLESISTMHIKVGDDDAIDVAAEKGMLLVSVDPDSPYDIVATATTKSGGKTQAYEGSFTSKKLTDTYMFKDGKVKENLAAWLSAKRSPEGEAKEQSVYLKNGGITYDTLEMVTDLKLSYQFGQSAAGMVDLLQCPNVVNIQVGRSWYADGVAFNNIPLFKERLAAVLTKDNFTKIEKVGIGKDVVIDGAGGASMSSAVKAAVKEVCTTNGITFVDEGIALKWPNEPGPIVPNTEAKKVTDISTLSLLDRSAWKVVAWSSHSTQEGSFPGMFDGNINTFWHSNWSAVWPLPQGFIIDMGATVTLKQVVMGMRQSGNPDSRAIKYTVSFCNTAAPADLVSGIPNPATTSYPNEGGVWTDIAGFTWSAPIEIINDVSSGDNWYNIFTLPSAQAARCIKVTVTYNKNKADNSFNISEFGVSNR